MSDEKTEKTLWDLKPGDTVVRHAHPYTKIEKVVRVTNQYIVLEHDRKYRKKDGCNVAGSAWNLSRISIPTPEKIAELQAKEEKARIYNTLQATIWHEKKVPFDVAKKIVALLMGDDGNENI